MATIENLKDEIYEEMLKYHPKEKTNLIKNDRKFKQLKMISKIPTLNLDGKISYGIKLSNFRRRRY